MTRPEVCMPAIVDCPSCNRKLRIPDELLGRKVKCPTCSTTFDAVASPAAAPPIPSAPPASFTPAPPPLAKPQAAPMPAPPPMANPQVAAGANPQAAMDAPLTAHKRCPYCGQNVVADAERCQHCGEALAGEDRPWEQYGTGVRRDCEPHRGAMILTLGIVSICFPLPGFCCGIFGLIFSGIGLGLGIPAIIMGKNDLAKMTMGVMDPQGRGVTQGGWICGIIGTSLSGLGLLVWLGSVVYLVVMVAAQAGR
jgi:predicted Zn finger-like uncharacterized protein